MLWVKLALAFVELLLGVFVILGIIIFMLAIRRPKKQKPPKDEMRIARQKIREKNNAALYAKNPEDVSVNTPDGLTLRGWFLPADTEAKRVVICIHGHKCNGPDEFSHMMPFYHERMGYHYLLPDLRGHGRSDGKYMTFGALDHKDMRLWLEWLIMRLGPQAEIILHGISMGAATAMLTGCDSPPPQLKLVVEDCGFSSCFAVIHNTFRDLFHFRFPALIHFTSLLSRVFAGFWFREADCLSRMQEMRLPILFIHGSADTYVPTQMGIDLHRACTAPKQLLLVEGAVHAYSYYDAPELYEQTVREFIAAQIGE